MSAPIREVERKARVGPGLFMTGLGIFAAVLTLLAGDVKLYEMRQEELALEEELEEKQEQLAELEDRAQTAPDLYQRAIAMGLAEPEDMIVLHIRGEMAD